MSEGVAAELATIARVIDFETTGLPEEGGIVCEAAFVDVDVRSIPFDLLNGWSSLIDPGVMIPPEISAIHHIIDADVRGKPAPADAFAELDRDHLPDDLFVAHNTRFEQAFFPTPKRWIDTYRCALRAWPDAPGWSNQVLRYWLGLDVDRGRAEPPHRALPDAYVTAHILRKLLLLRPISRLVEISNEPGFLPKLTFGKHYGVKFKEVERSYLEWIVKQADMDEDVLFTARYWLERR